MGMVGHGQTYLILTIRGHQRPLEANNGQACLILASYKTKTVNHVTPFSFFFFTEKACLENVIGGSEWKQKIF